MKAPRSFFGSVLCLLAFLTLVALPLVLAACDSLTSDTTAAPTTVAPATTEAATTPTTAAGQQTANQAAAANILFRDDFQDGDTEGWQVDGAWVVQQDGDVYTFTTTGLGHANVPKGVGWPGDYAFKASYLLTAGTLGFSFDATRDGRYFVSIGPELISLVKEDAAGTRTVLTQAQAPASGQRHFITMAKKSGSIQVYVDKVLWLAATDAAPLAAGTIMVGAVDGTQAWVDDVLVNKIGKNLPQGTPAVAPVDPADVEAPPEDDGGLDELPKSDDDVPVLNEENDPIEVLQPVVSFTAVSPGAAQAAEDFTVPAGTELTLHWSVDNAQVVYLDGVATDAQGARTVAPEEDTRYELEVIGLDGASHSYYIDVTVSEVRVLLGPDIVIQAEVSVQEGRRVQVSIHYWNVGDQAPDQCVIRWFPYGDDAPINKESSVSIPAGTDGVVEWQYTYDGFGTMHWLALADVPEGPHGDIDYSTNQATGSVTLVPGAG